jgi:transaldolase
MKQVDELTVKIFADGADRGSMLEMSRQSFIKGLTTNPSLMRQANVKNYKKFAQELLSEIKDKSISFEVFSDDFDVMEKQALEIASWGDNAYVKIPVTNTKQETCYSMVERLASQGVKLNVTALMTLDQVRRVTESLDPLVPSYISVFAGRIADTGRDPLPVMFNAVEIMKRNPASELIWASTRELYNIFQADQVGCHIITVTNDLINKMHLFGHDLDEFSLETVKMFYGDALAAGYEI